MPQATESCVHLPPPGHDVIGPDRFRQPGLVAVESIGPGMPVQRVGPVFMVHDSTFEPGCGIGHHPHRGMERLFYILEGAVAHDDAQNGITGHMGTGDLGILTEGRQGMLHSERNAAQGRTRCWILVYPCEPLVEHAAFDAIRADAMRVTEGQVAGGSRRTTHVVEPGDSRLHGDIRLFGDTTLDEGGEFEFALNADETGLLFVVDGDVAMVRAHDEVVLSPTHTVAWGTADHGREVMLRALRPARLLHVVMGPGDGLVRR
ncbi:MAG TPA: pirin family protein [Egibacteraceae bacterium]|nr:pirin family protein [Egibacteraceae bacterium]